MVDTPYKAGSTTKFQKVFTVVTDDSDTVIEYTNPFPIIISDGATTAEVTINTDQTDNLDGSSGLVTNSVQYGRISNDAVRPVQLDDATHVTTTIEYEHHEIHGGSHFFICGEVTLGDGGTKDFQITTPNSAKWLHMTFQYESTQEILLQIYEDANVDADGTDVTAYNNNRNSTNTTEVSLLQYDGTVNTAGTAIFSSRSGVAGNVNKARQGFGERSREIILKQNTTYRFLFTSGGADNNFSYCGEWYEHTDKN